DRQLLLYQVDDGNVAEIALAEVEACIVPYHQRETFRRRLVEAVLLFQALDEGGIKPLCSPIFRVDRIRARRTGLTAVTEIATAAGHPRQTAGVGARKLGNDAIDRPAGRKLHDDEGDEEDAEQCRQHQQDTT